MTPRQKLLFLINPFIAVFLTSFAYDVLAQEQWRGLIVEPENRCSPYIRKEQYPYSQNLEDELVRLMDGQIYGPYTGRYFSTDTLTDIEHIVAAAEGHDSGLCSATQELRKEFASDPLNLTLAGEEVNRCSTNGKCDHDAGEWLPEKNKCWFANRVVQVKKKYNLSVDQAEADALEKVLVDCDSFEMIVYPKTENNLVYPKAIQNTDNATRTDNALALYDENGNGRISCSEARIHGIAPVTKEHPAYVFMSDRDGDGVVCE